MFHGRDVNIFIFCMTSILEMMITVILVILLIRIMIVMVIFTMIVVKILTVTVITDSHSGNMLRLTMMIVAIFTVVKTIIILRWL